MTAGTGKYGGRKVREGTVVSDKMDKTLVVKIASASKHPLYKKIIRHSRHYMVHDEHGEAHTGDRVRIVEAAPVSKTKRWRLAEVLRQVDLPDLAPGEIDLEIIGEVKAEEEEAPAAPEAVSGPAAEAAEPPAEVAAEEPAAPQPEEVVQEDAAPEALETPEEVKPPEAVEPAEPESPPVEEEEVVQQDAAPEATPTEEAAPAEETTEEAEAEKPEGEEKPE